MENIAGWQYIRFSGARNLTYFPIQGFPVFPRYYLLFFALNAVVFLIKKESTTR